MRQRLHGIRLIVAIGFGASACVACGGDGDGPADEPDAPVGGSGGSGGSRADRSKQDEAEPPIGVPPAAGTVGGTPQMPILPQTPQAPDPPQTRLAFSVRACAGPLARGIDGTILVPCSRGRENVFERYSVDGARVDAWPRAVIDDGSEAEFEPSAILELPGGDFVIAVRVRRNISSGNAGNQSRIRVYRFAPDRTLRFQTEITKFPDGPNEYPYGLATAATDPDGSVAVTGHANSGGTGNTAIVAVLNDVGELQWRWNSDSVAAGRAVALTASGEVYVAAETGYSFESNSFMWPALWALDASGQERWKWQDPPSLTPQELLTSPNTDAYMVGGVYLRSIELAEDGGVELIGRQMQEDELVTNPPHSTAELWHRRFDAATGQETAKIVLASFGADRTSWDELALRAPQPEFGRNGTGIAMAFGPDGALGLSADGQLLWEVPEAVAPAGWTFGAIEIGAVFCLSVVDKDPFLKCYRTAAE